MVRLRDRMYKGRQGQEGTSKGEMRNVELLSGCFLASVTPLRFLNKCPENTGRTGRSHRQEMRDCSADLKGTKNVTRS